MWKLSVATGNSPWLTSLSDFPGRQVWEYDADAGTPEERAAVEDVRAKFAAGRETMKHSSDELMRLQVIATLRHRLTRICFRLLESNRDFQVGRVGLNPFMI